MTIRRNSAPSEAMLRRIGVGAARGVEPADPSSPCSTPPSSSSPPSPPTPCSHNPTSPASSTIARPLHVHRQPDHRARRPRTALPTPLRPRLPRTGPPQPRPPRSARHPDHSPTQPLPLLPPLVGQAFLIEPTVAHESTGKRTVESAYGLTRHSPAPPNVSSRSTGHTGVSKPLITSSAPPSTKTNAASEPDTAPKTPPDSGASPAASSAPIPNREARRQ